MEQSKVVLDTGLAVPEQQVVNADETAVYGMAVFHNRIGNNLEVMSLPLRGQDLIEGSMYGRSRTAVAAAGIREEQTDLRSRH